MMRLRARTQQFTRLITDSIAPIIQRSTAKERVVVNERLLASLLGRPDPPVSRLPDLRRDDEFAVRMFRHYGEVFACIERLKDFETYIAKFPFAGTRVSRAAYLQLIVESHLHEIYILQQRVEAWLKRIDRSYRKDRRAAEIHDNCARLAALLKNSLASTVHVRGQHVHESRYDHPDVARLRLIDILSLGRSDAVSVAVRLLKRVAAKESHSRLRAQAKQWNRGVSALLEAIFTVLTQIMFESSGAMRYPSSSR